MVGTHRRPQNQQQRQGQGEDAERDRSVEHGDQQKSGANQQRQQRLHLVHPHRQGVVGGGKHLDQRNKMEEKAADGRGDAELLPPGLVIKHRRQCRNARNGVKHRSNS